MEIIYIIGDNVNEINYENLHDIIFDYGELSPSPIPIDFINLRAVYILRDTTYFRM